MHRPQLTRRLSLLSACLLLFGALMLSLRALPAGAQEKPQAEQAQADRPAALIIAGDRVLTIHTRFGAFTPDQRIEHIRQQLQKLLKDPSFRVGSIRAVEDRDTTDIVSGETVIFSITDEDARAAGKSRDLLAKEYVSNLRYALSSDIKARTPKDIAIGAGKTLAATVLLLVVLKLYGLVFPWLYRTVRAWRGVYVRTIKIQQAVLLPEGTLMDLIVGVLRLSRLALTVATLFIYAIFALSFFTATKGIAIEAVEYLVQPITTVVWPAIVSYIPNIFFVAVIVAGSYYVISFTHFLFREIERKTISFPGFDPEWADPTYKIVRFLLIAFAVVLAFPYLPGSGSPAFQQVSIFLGILLSLSSTSAMAHIIAGVFLTYTGAFRLNDRVKISDTVGDVVQKTLLATRVRTIKNEVITIPNGMVLGSHIINYSHSLQNPGLILHTTITLGYDAPWREVHEAMVEAALATEGLLSEPRPFVLQTALNDYSVAYQINAYTNRPSAMAVIYSKLHENLQDKLSEAGIEIMSPQYHAVRDGNQTTIPEQYLPAGYQAPGFRLAPLPAGRERPAPGDGPGA